MGHSLYDGLTENKNQIFVVVDFVVSLWTSTSYKNLLIETILTSGQTGFGEKITQVVSIEVNITHLIWISVLLLQSTR